jgi:hypothetical protein
MINTKEIFKDYKMPNLPALHWLVITTIFLLGVSFLLLGRIFEKQGILSQFLDLVGSFLVIAIPLEILREFFFEKISRESFVRQVSKLFDEKIDTEMMQTRKFGLSRIYDFLPIEKLFDDLLPGDTLWWLDTYCPGHKRWIENVKNAIQRDVIINMLVLDPSSPFCSLRAQEIGGLYTTDSYISELKLFIKDFEKCRDVLTSQNALGYLDIIIYNDLLGVPCYIVTRNEKPIYAYSSMFLTKSTGTGFPHFYWEQGPMCISLYQYVKEKYDKNKAAKNANDASNDFQTFKISNNDSLPRFNE